MASGDIVLQTTGGFNCTLAMADTGNDTWRVELSGNGIDTSVPSTTEDDSSSNVTFVLNGASTTLALAVANNGPDDLTFSTTLKYDITIKEH